MTFNSGADRTSELTDAQLDQLLDAANAEILDHIEVAVDPNRTLNAIMSWNSPAPPGKATAGGRSPTALMIRVREFASALLNAHEAVGALRRRRAEQAYGFDRGKTRREAAADRRAVRVAVGKARIILATHERLIVTYTAADHTVYVLTPPGEDPAAVLRAARLILPEDTYEELAGHLATSAVWPLE